MNAVRGLRGPPAATRIAQSGAPRPKPRFPVRRTDDPGACCDASRFSEVYCVIEVRRLLHKR